MFFLLVDLVFLAFNLSRTRSLRTIPDKREFMFLWEYYGVALALGIGKMLLPFIIMLNEAAIAGGRTDPTGCWRQANTSIGGSGLRANFGMMMFGALVSFGAARTLETGVNVSTTDITSLTTAYSFGAFCTAMYQVSHETFAIIDIPAMLALFYLHIAFLSTSLSHTKINRYKLLIMVVVLGMVACVIAMIVIFLHFDSFEEDSGCKTCPVAYYWVFPIVLYSKNTQTKATFGMLMATTITTCIPPSGAPSTRPITLGLGVLTGRR